MRSRRWRTVIGLVAAALSIALNWIHVLANGVRLSANAPWIAGALGVGLVAAVIATRSTDGRVRRFVRYATAGGIGVGVGRLAGSPLPVEAATSGSAAVIVFVATVATICCVYWFLGMVAKGQDARPSA